MTSGTTMFGSRTADTLIAVRRPLQLAALVALLLWAQLAVAAAVPPPVLDDCAIASRGGVRRIDDAASAATTVGRRGQQVKFPNPNARIPRNVPGTIGGREFSGHALDRMQERGFVPSVIENAIQHGTQSAGSPAGTMLYFDAVNKVNVVVATVSGRVVTVF